MNIKEFYEILTNNPNATISWILPNENNVPDHYHVTEIGKVTKQFFDCGGTERTTEKCSLQLWVANDLNHRLQTDKLVEIINKAKNILNDNLKIEVEFQNETLSIYTINDVLIDNNNNLFVKLAIKYTDCLAPEKCKVDSSCCKNDCCC